ncbi:MAG TPA: DUF4199 domain-containing protein [Chitinophagaceae bacterium]|jgi:hypothetical protein|nr:DUF4199 domain-containing protein [Chitinophagaceae bacterium]
MKKNILVFGLFAGLISCLNLLAVTIMSNRGFDFDNGMWIGYASMLLAFSLIFVAVKNYRDRYNNGVISFGKAFKIGLYITLIAATVYVVAWLIDYYYFIPDFAEKYSAHMIQKLRDSGASEAEINKQTAEMAGFQKMYQNPFFNAMITYTEILPVGLLVSLTCALILKRKRTEKFAEAIN